MTRRRPSGFTLVELLTVIGILLLLMGLAMPATKAITLSMKKAQAQTDCNRIQNALASYNQEYGRYPVSPYATWTAMGQGKNPPDGGFCGEWQEANGRSQQTWMFAPQVSILVGYPWDREDALCGLAVTNFNSRGIPFLTVNDKDRQKCYNNQDTSATPQWGFGDPFIVKEKGTYKNLRLPYKVKVDANGNTEIEHYKRIFRRKVVAWSLGPDGIEAELDKSPKTNDDIADWGTYLRLIP